MTATLTLRQAPLHTPLSLLECTADRALRTRLATLGLRTGAPLEVVQRTGGDGRVIAIAGARVALDHTVLDQLTVRA